MIRCKLVRREELEPIVKVYFAELELSGDRCMQSLKGKRKLFAKTNLTVIEAVDNGQ